ncbi:L-lactate dehydrogenase [Kurthia sibirica]|uniref:L-lactate dehydrogenase n=1 Tax=Kurthia sibirica TaxID=202750 RepID=A0A2U3ANE5_9BACL|nr:L-lactate dehydrogenase [Kurthia sibirica]PWI26041.1 L-lactate dehydrogenase [Kurthia sibirica]GEK34558.1 L-lactate dehydrogenase [Kurthia sibirica]
MGLTLGNKVVLIGTGSVGSSYAFALMNQGLCDHLVLVDLDAEKAEGDALDLEHGIVYAPSNLQVKQGTYSDCHDAAIVVICAGAAQKPGETRLDLVNKNVAIFEKIVGEIMKSGFDGIIIVAANPVDILAYATLKFSGLHKSRVISSGTILDSARLRTVLGNEFNTSPTSVHAYIIGEHGDSQLPYWSAATLYGQQIGPMLTPQRRDEIAVEVRDVAYKIIESKGATFYGIAMGLARITKAILKNEHVVLPVGAMQSGENGHSDVFTGVPCLINRQGIEKVFALELDDDERQKFDASVNTLQSIQQSIWS